MNNFVIDYNKKELTLFFEGETHKFNLDEGDVGDFWHSFTNKKGVTKDINFYQEDENEQPSLSVYDLKEEGEHTVVDTSTGVYITECKTIGNPKNYFC